MKLKLAIYPIIFLILCLPIFAELSAVKDSDDNYSSLIFMYTDYPCSQIWEKLSINPNRITLNENGDLNSDGKPAFSINPATGLPAVVWSKFDGTDYEIAYSYFDGLIWSNYEIITNNDIDDYDPRIAFGNDGIVKVVWWSDEATQQVYYKIRRNNGEWSLKLRVSDPLGKSRYPSIIAEGNLSYVSYESLLHPDQKNIHLSTIDDDPDPFPLLCSKIIMGLADSTQNCQAALYSQHGHKWVDWIYDENSLCWREKIGEEWTPQRYEAYSGLDDIARARLYIKIKVLNGQ